MFPGTDQDLRALAGRFGCALFGEALEVPPALVDEIVVPAGHEVGRDLDLAVLLLDPVGLPVMVVFGMGEPVLHVLDLRELVYGRQQGQPAIVGIFRRQDLLGLGALLGEEPELEDHIQLHDAVVVEVSEVGLLVLARHQTLQVGAAQWRRHHLRETVVGDPHGADLSVRPWLLTEPLLGVIAIAGFVHVGNPFPAGIVAPPGIHQGDGITSLGEVLGVFILEGSPKISQQHERRKLAGRIGTVDVGGQVDAVLHGDGYFALIDNFVNGLRWTGGIGARSRAGREKQE